MVTERYTWRLIYRYVVTWGDLLSAAIEGVAVMVGDSYIGNFML